MAGHMCGGSLAAFLAAGTALAGVNNTAEVGLVFRADPKASVLWQTASPDAQGNVSVVLSWPTTATRAVLTVVAGNVTTDHAITDTTASSYAVALPKPLQARDEKVCDLTLRYYADETLLSTETAKVASVLGTGNAELVPIADPANTRRWAKSEASAVLPIPDGATALTIDGVLVAETSYAAPGWYWWRGISGGVHTVSYTDADGVVQTATVKGKSGIMLLIK